MGKMIEYNGNGSAVPGYLAMPEGDGPFPAAVVIQEWWGLNDHIKDVAERMAAAGFAALAPDLYRGQVATEPDEARKLAMEMVRDDAIRDIQMAVDYLRKQDNVMPKSIGVMGFCMGGGLAAWMSLLGEHVGAVSVFYGRLPITPENASDVKAAFMGNFGEADGGIPVAGVREVEALLQQAGKTVDIKVYDDAPHAFFNDTRPSSFRETEADDAWQRTLSWFRTHLR